jgi:gluconate kinase
MAAAAPDPDPAAGAEAVLITGVYGSGKTTLAIELADVLDRAGTPVAAIDLDWLGWYSAPVDWDEHDDPRMTLRNLGSLSRAYLGAGVRRLVLAGSFPPESLDAMREAVGVPLKVVRLRVQASVVRARLEGDPNASRADDLAQALERLDEGDDGTQVDAEVDADAPVSNLAAEVLAVIGWVPD